MYSSETDTNSIVNRSISFRHDSYNIGVRDILSESYRIALTPILYLSCLYVWLIRLSEYVSQRLYVV